MKRIIKLFGRKQDTAPVPSVRVTVKPDARPAAVQTQPDTSVVAPPPKAQVAAATSPPPASDLERDRSLFQALLSGLYDGILILDGKGYVIASNQRVAQFTGYTEAELWNMPCNDLFATITQRVLMKIASYVDAGRFTVVTADCRRKDGTVFAAEIAISRIHFLNDGDFVFSIRSMERRTKARQRHELEQEAIRQAAAGIAVCALEGQIEYANPALLRQLGVTDEAAVTGRLLSDFLAVPAMADTVLLRTKAQGFWLGQIELLTSANLRRVTSGSAGLCPAKPDTPPRIVLTFTPLPATITAVSGNG